MTIQWGANTVHTFDKGSTATGGVPALPGPPGAAPSAPAFPTFGSGAPLGAPAPIAASTTTTPLFGGAPAAAPTTAPGTGGGLFGGSSTSAPTAAAPIFGAPPSTPATTSLFGAPGAAPGAASSTSFGGGLFGSSLSTTPTSAGGLFGGSTTAGAPSAFGSSLSFGASSSGAFGAPPASGLFGSSLGGASSSTQQQQPQQPFMVPAQAALQAHQNAEARQEEARIASALDAIHKAYAGTAVVGPDVVGPDDGDWGMSQSGSSTSSAPFSLIYYTEISPELRQQQWLQGMIVGGGGVDGTPAMVRPVVPPRPWQVSGRDWRTAAARNPDPASCMPAVLLGASALQSRIAYQQESANQVTEQLQLVRDTLESLRQQSVNLQTQVANKVAHRRSTQKSQLLSILRKVELVRSFQVPLQNGEVQALERLVNLHRDVERTVQPAVRRLRDEAQRLKSGDAAGRKQSRGTAASGLGSMTPEQIVGLEHSLQYELGPCIVRVQTALDKEGRDVALVKRRVDTAPLPALPPPPVASLRR